MSYLLCLLCAAALVLVTIHSAVAADWSPPVVKLPADLKHPFVACLPNELARLKAAYQGKGPEHAVLADVVKKADEAMAKPVVYPPRGGQHNQWYQCDACQIALKTVDDSHHQCPKCKKVYTGAPYDDVIYSKVHDTNLKEARFKALAFAVTGDRKYADAATAVLKGYAQRYNTYPYHDNSAPGSKPGKTGGHLFEQTLNEAVAMSWRIAPTYDLIYDTLSPADRKDIEENLIRPMLANIEKNRAGKNNWQTWHNAAFITGGAVIGDEAWVKRAINDPENGLLHQMKVSVSQDGMWYENSWGYHFYTLQAMTTIAEQARRLGIDVWHHPRMRAMYTLPVRYTMPDGTLPRYGDDVTSSALKQSPLMAQAAAAYKDPMLAQLVVEPGIESILLGQPATGKAVPPAMQGSEVFRSAGHAILRTKGEAGLAAAITFGEFGGFHGHFDKLSFVFFGYGQELGVDPGRAASQAYRLPIHKNWYRATLAHNAVVVDGKSQEGAEGKLLAFAANDQYAAVVAECKTAYKGVDHKRTLWLTPSYLLVIDEIGGADEHRFDWVYHQRGTAVTSPTAMQDGTLPEPYTGNEFLQNIKAGTSDEQICVDFSGEVDLRMTFRGEQNTGLLLADGPGKSVDERIPMAMLRQTGRGARFVVVLEPVAKGQKPKVSNVEVRQDPKEPGAHIVVTRDGIEDRFQVTDKQLVATSAGQTVLQGNHSLSK